MKKISSILSNLQTNLFMIDLPKIDRHARSKWLIHGPKHHKDNQSQSLKRHCRIFYLGCKDHTRESQSNDFIAMFSKVIIPWITAVIPENLTIHLVCSDEGSMRRDIYTVAFDSASRSATLFLAYPCVNCEASTKYMYLYPLYGVFLAIHIKPNI